MIGEANPIAALTAGGGTEAEEVMSDDDDDGDSNGDIKLSGTGGSGRVRLNSNS